jgi:hypothetical protein
MNQDNLSPDLHRCFASHTLTSFQEFAAGTTEGLIHPWGIFLTCSSGYFVQKQRDVRAARRPQQQFLVMERNKNIVNYQKAPVRCDSALRGGDQCADAAAI